MCFKASIGKVEQNKKDAIKVATGFSFKASIGKVELMYNGTTLEKKNAKFQSLNR